MSILKQVLVILLLLLGFAGGGYGYFLIQTGETSSSPPGKTRLLNVQLAAARTGSIKIEVEAVGTALARQAIDLVALVPGRIEDIRFKPGQNVRKGEVLVRLDNKAERAALDEADAGVKEAMLALQRARKLRKNNTISQAAVEKLEAQVNAGQARLALMEKRLSDRTIHAPFDGVMGLRRVHVGARVDAQTVLSTLDDLSEIEINFSIPEIHFSRIGVGKAVTATTAVFSDRVFNGRITSIDTRIQQASRAFKVHAVLANPDGMIPAGMFMHVSVMISEMEAILIPEEAVIAEGSRTYVFTIEGQKAKLRPVTLGHRSRGQVAVLKGLAPGENVVQLGHHRLRDGSKVRIVKPDDRPGKAIRGAAG